MSALARCCWRALLASFCGILYQLTRILLGAPRMERRTDGGSWDGVPAMGLMLGSLAVFSFWFPGPLLRRHAPRGRHYRRPPVSGCLRLDPARDPQLALRQCASGFRRGGYHDSAIPPRCAVAGRFAVPCDQFQASMGNGQRHRFCRGCGARGNLGLRVADSGPVTTLDGFLRADSLSAIGDRCDCFRGAGLARSTPSGIFAGTCSRA